MAGGKGAPQGCARAVKQAVPAEQQSCRTVLVVTKSGLQRFEVQTSAILGVDGGCGGSTGEGGCLLLLATGMSMALPLLLGIRGRVRCGGCRGQAWGSGFGSGLGGLGVGWAFFFALKQSIVHRHMGRTCAL